MPKERKPIDWEGIEREYRAGQLSVRAIAAKHKITDTAIRLRAKSENWERALADKVRKQVKEKLARIDGDTSHFAPTSHPQRARSDAEIVETASIRGLEVITSHRKDIIQLHGLKRILATRLATILEGGQADGPCLGEKESPSDLIEKLSRVTARLIPLERQAHNLDAAPEDLPPSSAAAAMSERRFEEIARRVGDEF